MFFEFAAPYYDRFIKLVKLDYSTLMPEWLAPVKDMEVLDLGGGTGINAFTLAGAGARVTVADSSHAMLLQAAAKDTPARLILAEAVSLPLPDNYFDIVLVSDAWHHFRNQGGVVRELVRVLRPGGRLYVIDFDRRKLKTRVLAFLESLVDEPSTFTAPDELVDILQPAGIAGDYRYLTSNQFIYKGVNTKGVRC